MEVTIVKPLEIEIDPRTKFRQFWEVFYFAEVHIELTDAQKMRLFRRGFHFREVSILRGSTVLGEYWLHWKCSNVIDGYFLGP